MNQGSTADICQALANSDKVVYEGLFHQYYPYLRVVASRYMRDVGSVEDIIHDVFFDLWKNRERLQIKLHVKAYLRGATINKCLAKLRKESRMEYPETQIEQPIREVGIVEELAGAELQQVINEIVNGLPEKCREVFRLSRVEGKSHKEIAAELDISTKTIENHMSKALKALRETLSAKNYLKKLMIIMIYFLLG